MGKREEILGAAEARIRRHGFHGFSFREVAADVGVKSSSVHYHFATKELLAAAAARGYAQRFLEHLGDATDGRSAEEKVERVRVAFRNAHVKDGLMCLCGALGAEFSSLPSSVGEETKRFFAELRSWLGAALAEQGGAGAALRIVCMLEGALLVTQAFEEVSYFDTATAELDQLLSSPDETTSS